MRELFLSNSCLSKHVKKNLNGPLFCGVNLWHFKSVINLRYKANKLDRCPFWKYNYTQMLNFSKFISVHWNGKNCWCTFKFFSFVLFFAGARLCLNKVPGLRTETELDLHWKRTCPLTCLKAKMFTFSDFAFIKFELMIKRKKTGRTLKKLENKVVLTNNF